MKKRILTCSLMMIFCVSYAQIYQWTDSQGVVHFSDIPHQGAKTVATPEVQSYSAPQPQSTVPQIENTKVEQDTKAKQDTKNHQYKTVQIIQPSDQATIRNNQGNVTVSVKIEPALFPGDTLQLLFDGTPWGVAQANTLFQVTGVYRGSHTIAVQVLDSHGNVLGTSEQIMVYMQQPRVGMFHPSAAQ